MRPDARRGHRLPRDLDRRPPDLIGVVLNPARRRVTLRDLAVGLGDHGAALVDDQSGRSGRSLIQREDRPPAHPSAVRNLRINAISWR